MSIKDGDSTPVQHDAKLPVRRSVTITMSLEVAETLYSLIDGGIGTSDSDEFNAEMIPLRDKLERRIKKHYA